MIEKIQEESILTKPILYALVKACSSRFKDYCFPDFEYEKNLDFFEGMIEALFGVCMVLTDDWSSDSCYLAELCSKEREKFFGGKKK